MKVEGALGGGSSSLSSVPELIGDSDVCVGLSCAQLLFVVKKKVEADLWVGNTPRTDGNNLRRVSVS